jgi:hypothetical protein
MGEVTSIVPLTNDIILLLRERLNDALKGDISGIVLLCEYDNVHTIDTPGAFSIDPESVAALVGKLTIAANHFSSVSFMDGEEDEDYDE